MGCTEGLSVENGLSCMKLNEKQIKLRDSIQGETTYISDGETTLIDLAYALSDTYKPLTIKLQRGDEEIIIEPAFVSYRPYY